LDTYWWLTLRVPRADAELVGDGLFELGATGLEEAEEGPDPAAPTASVGLPTASVGGNVLLKAYFEDRARFDGAVAIHGTAPGFAAGEAPVEDWDRSWRDRQTPVEVTPGLVVAPPWVDPGPARHVIRLEAKMAFGTGSHESTRIAAMLLETIPLQGRSVLDIGTGTGILALYAALLGAGHVLALDIDPVTGPCLHENQALNPLPPGCRFQPYVGELGSLRAEARFDVILCNMIRTELWPFREELRSRLKPGGRFVVSGQRREDKPYFQAWQRQSPFRMAEERELDDWWGFAASVE
jgi:ribosomal protein L11 methyltransferase